MASASQSGSSTSGNASRLPSQKPASTPTNRAFQKGGPRGGEWSGDGDDSSVGTSADSSAPEVLLADSSGEGGDASVVFGSPSEGAPDGSASSQSSKASPIQWEIKPSDPVNPGTPASDTPGASRDPSVPGDEDDDP